MIRLLAPVAAIICAFGAAAVAAIYFLTQPIGAVAPAVAAVVAGGAAAPRAPLATRERRGEPVRPSAPALEVEPLFDTSARLKPGETARLRFRARRTEPSSAADAPISLTLLHGRDRELRLPARELGGGEYEAEFTPDAPGQYRVVVSSGAAGIRPVASLGVVGAVGGASVDDDISTALEDGPRSSRWKGVARRRR